MKVIIAGSRSLLRNPSKDDLDEITKAVINSKFSVTEVVSGGALGVDRAGDLWAESLPIPIPVRKFPADWSRYGPYAGFHRNKQMAEYADALIVFWYGASRGPRQMIWVMMGQNKPIYHAQIGGLTAP